MHIATCQLGVKEDNTNRLHDDVDLLVVTVDGRRLLGMRLSMTVPGARHI